MATTYLTRTPSSTGNRKIFTISAWIKRSKTGNNQKVITAGTSGTEGGLQFSTGTGENCLKFYEYVGSEVISIAPNRILRDTSAWYHVVIAVDTTQATASNRVKYYLNGVQETSFATATYPSQNYDTLFNNSGTANTIGFLIGHSAYFDGSMSHVHFIDGTAYDASYFGSTDSTTGEWTIKTSPSVTYGNNGFFILKDSGSVTDQSGNSNNFTVGGGTLTKTEDNPSNVFCVLNRLNSDQPTGSVNISNGNLTFADGENGSNYSYASGTLGASSGKYYWETKVIDLAEIDQVGVVLASSNFMGAANSTGLQGTAYGGKGFQFSNGNKVGDGSQSAYMGGFSVNDIAMIALDLDNNKITFGRNGQWSNGSGGADQTYANSTPAYTNLTAGEFYFPAQAKRAFGANYGTNHYNFGNGYFQTTAVASAGTNASGNGIFEYDVPTGYTALSTKGLNL